MDAKKLNRSTNNIPEFLYNYSFDDENNMYIPRGMRRPLIELASQLNVAITIDDQRELKHNVDYIDGSNIIYRPYQEPAIYNLLATSTEGILVAPPGSGKTVMGVSLLPVLMQPTLWLTHTSVLFKQSYNRCREFLPDLKDSDIGIIGNGKWSLGDILTIAMIPTLVRNLDKLSKLQNNFGLVILDECLVAGTKIAMLDGTERDIKNIENKDETTFGTVSNKFKRITNSLIELSSTVGKIRGTATHMLPSIPKSKITVNDGAIQNSIRFSSMSNIAIGDYLLTNRKDVCGKVIKFRGALYRCTKVINKRMINKRTIVYDFTTDQHLFIANNILSSNCHHCPASTFLKVITLLNPYFLYGLTATAYRTDGLENIMFQVLGPVTTEISKDEVAKYNGIISPTILYCPLNFGDRVNSNNIPKILKDVIIFNDLRNLRIKNDVLREAKAGNFCIVVSERRIHCDILYEIIKQSWPRTGIATGKYSKKEINRVIKAFNKNEITVLIATSELLGEGFDIDFLNRLFITTSFRAESRVEQLIGRVQRSHPNKKDALVFDYVDENIGVFRDQFRSINGKCRSNVYNRLKLTVINYNDYIRNK